MKGLKIKLLLLSWMMILGFNVDYYADTVNYQTPSNSVCSGLGTVSGTYIQGAAQNGIRVSCASGKLTDYVVRKNGYNIYQANFTNGVVTKEYEFKANSNKYAQYNEYTSGKLTKKRTYFKTLDQIETEWKYSTSGNKLEYRKYNTNGSFTRTKYTSNRRSVVEKFNTAEKRTAKTEYYSNGKTKKTYATYYSGGTKYKTLTKYNSNGVRIEYRSYKTDGSYSRNKYVSGKRTTNEMFDRYNRRTAKTDYRSNGKVKAKYTYYSGGTRYKTKTSYWTNGKRHLKYYYANRSGTYVTKIQYFNKSGNLVKTEYYKGIKNMYKVVSNIKNKKLKGYKTVNVSTCNMSKTRRKNVVVDIGVDSKFANRDYYAYTNGSGQLVKVTAAQIIPQSEKYEKVVKASNGKKTELRYCRDEAHVTGVNSRFDSGHVIADSFGAVANSYNITPERETLNLYGGQYQMEEQIRKAIYDKRQTVTNFEMNIYYKNKKTNVPYKYVATYRIDGKKYTKTFYNK